MERLYGKTEYTHADLQKLLDDGKMEIRTQAIVPERVYRIHRDSDGELFLRELMTDGTSGVPTMAVPEAEQPPEGIGD